MESILNLSNLATIFSIVALIGMFVIYCLFSNKLNEINEYVLKHTNKIDKDLNEVKELKATHTILEKCLNSSKKQDKVNATCLWFDGQKVTKAHSSDAGWDLQMPKDLTFKGINNGGDAVQNYIITTNHKVLIPNGCVGLILPRSSTQKLGVDLPVGVIDPGYKGYLKIGVRAINIKDDLTIKKGERIAQLVIVRLSSHRNLIRTDFSAIQTQRGDKGFGSSGK